MPTWSSSSQRAGQCQPCAVIQNVIKSDTYKDNVSHQHGGGGWGSSKVFRTAKQASEHCWCCFAAAA